jgi:putative cardiolipin synthase
MTYDYKKPDQQSGFHLLIDNTDAFVARFALTTAAKKTLDIQYYIMHNDASGQYLAYAILSAADRGVHVRILVDDINLSGRETSLKMLSQHENIEIRIFNPLTHRNWFRHIELVINLDRAGRRMHNKVFISDGSAAIIGGRNIGDEYFDARQNLNFVDLDLLTIGPVIEHISSSFNDYWNSHWATPVEQLSKTKVAAIQLTTIRNKLKDRWHQARNTKYFQSLKHADLTRKIISKQIPFVYADAHLFYDRPEKLSGSKPAELIYFGSKIMPFFNDIKEELLIASPYFVPGIAGAQWLKEKQAAGTDIKILTNSLSATDVIAVHAGYKKYRKQLLQSGINLFELKANAQHVSDKTRNFLKGISNSSMHAKYMIIDRRYVFIGSANIDPRSNALNTEIGIMIDSKELAEQARRLFQRTCDLENSFQLKTDTAGDKLNWTTIENKKTIHYHSEPDANLLKKIAVFILGLLPFESLL